MYIYSGEHEIIIHVGNGEALINLQLRAVGIFYYIFEMEWMRKCYFILGQKLYTLQTINGNYSQFFFSHSSFSDQE